MENEEKEITEETVKTEEKVEEKVVKSKSIEELEKEMATIIAERDKFKKERDEANSNLREMSTGKKEDEKSEFDELFGGVRKWLLNQCVTKTETLLQM